MNQRFLFPVTVCAAILGVSAFAETEYPLYVIDTDAGTLAAPAAIESVSITKYAAAEAEPETTDFAAITASPLGAGTFVKRGSGYVMGSTAFETFTGEVRVEEGAWVVDRPGMCGSTNTIATAADRHPITFAVSNGAAFVCAATKAAFPNGDVYGNPLMRYTKFYLEGTGPDGYGAFLNVSTLSMNCACLGTTMTLTGDATFGEKGVNSRFDLGSGAVVDLQEHNLLIKNHISETAYNGVFTPDCTVKNPGSIKAEGTSILMQSSPSFKGDASTVFTFDRHSSLQTWNASMSASRLPWTLYFTGDSSITPGRNAKEEEFDESSNYFDAPVVIDQDRIYANSDGKGNGVAFNGRVSGRGGFYFGGELSLALNCATNVFEGPAAVNGGAKYTYSSVLRLGADGALPVNGAGAKLTNAFLRLTKAIPYHLPQLDFHTRLARPTNYWAEGGAQGTVAGLRKTGAQTLEWRAPLSVTGLTEIVEGTLKLTPAATPEVLHSAVPGLYQWEIGGAGTYADTMAYSIWTNADWAVQSNLVVGAMEGLRQSTDWAPWVTHVWHGYVWNRSSTNETWTFARSIRGYSRLMIDRKVEWGTDNNGAVIRDNREMTPGPHEILLRVNPRSYGGHGSGKNVATWANNMGLAIDRSGRGTTNAEDYVFFENGHLDTVIGGDGALFTRDARTREEFTLEELAACVRSANFTAVKAHAGTVLDIAMPDAPTATPLVVEDFIGANVVSNGSLSIVKSWTILADEVKDQSLVLADGALRIGPDVTLDVEGSEDLHGGAPIRIARAKEGITGLPKVKDDLRADGWTVYLKDGDLWLQHCAGTVLIFR